MRAPAQAAASLQLLHFEKAHKGRSPQPGPDSSTRALRAWGCVAPNGRNSDPRWTTQTSQIQKEALPKTLCPSTELLLPHSPIDVVVCADRGYQVPCCR